MLFLRWRVMSNNDMEDQAHLFIFCSFPAPHQSLSSTGKLDPLRPVQLWLFFVGYDLKGIKGCFEGMNFVIFLFGTWAFCLYILFHAKSIFLILVYRTCFANWKSFFLIPLVRISHHPVILLLYRSYISYAYFFFQKVICLNHLSF